MSTSAKTSRPGALQAQGGNKDSGSFHVSARPASALDSFQVWVPVVLAASTPAGGETETERHTNRQTG